MLEFYDSNKANRAINTYIDFANSEEMENKELLVLTAISYLENTTCFYLKRILGVNVLPQVMDLTEKGYVTSERSGNERKVQINYTPVNAQVFSDNIMYVFANALFNVGKYVGEYKVTSWNTLASIVELPIHIQKNGVVNYEYDLLGCIGGNKANKSYNRKKLIDIGVIRRVAGSTQNHSYKLNQQAYLLGAV